MKGMEGSIISVPFSSDLLLFRQPREKVRTSLAVLVASFKRRSSASLQNAKSFILLSWVL